MEEIGRLVTPLLEGSNLLFDPLLGRGLDYYTGVLFEILAPGLDSFAALGGRYDRLVAHFAGQQLLACGGSIYMDRVALLLQDREWQPVPAARVLVTVRDEGFRLESLKLGRTLRELGVGAELYLGEGNLGRQLRYASEKKIPYCLLLGPEESSRGEVVIKEMATGNQRAVPRDRVAEELSLGDGPPGVGQLHP